MSDRLAKQVADKLRAIDEWGSRGDVMSVRNALPALAELVEAGHELRLMTSDHCAEGSQTEKCRFCNNSRERWDEALRRVAESLGVTNETA